MAIRVPNLLEPIKAFNRHFKPVLSPILRLNLLSSPSANLMLYFAE